MSKVLERIRRRIRRARDDQAIRLGPVTLVRSALLERVLGRMRDAEGKLYGGDTVPYSYDGRKARRSVVFLHNAYYNFYYLARALRARGWDALSVSLEAPDGPHAPFYHGEDVNLFDPEPRRFLSNITEFFRAVPERFRMVHFYGRGHMSFFPIRFDHGSGFDAVPSDFILLRQRGIKIGYTVCGCLDGVAQSSVHSWSGGACDRCVWQDNPAICSDRSNLAWGHKLRLFCDLIATETFPALDYQDGPICFREPLTSALDEDFWNPNLTIPERHRLHREPGELIVYHSVGNFDLRTAGGRNLKGTGAIVAAIDRLRSEGVKVRLEFVKDMPNREVRFIQAQADVIVDQLNYGRYGAAAREAMMLGKPTICNLNRDEPRPDARLRSLEECPLIFADEGSIYPVLKRLLGDAERRREIGTASRAYAVKWHSAGACAARFERVYEHLMAGESVAAEVA
jgi:glycosyltransferase involved in cell wall biosynthesis